MARASLPATRVTFSRIPTGSQLLPALFNGILHRTQGIDVLALTQPYFEHFPSIFAEGSVWQKLNRFHSLS